MPAPARTWEASVGDTARGAGPVLRGIHVVCTQLCKARNTSPRTDNHKLRTNRNKDRGRFDTRLAVRNPARCNQTPLHSHLAGGTIGHIGNRHNPTESTLERYAGWLRSWQTRTKALILETQLASQSTYRGWSALSYYRPDAVRGFCLIGKVHQDTRRRTVWHDSLSSHMLAAVAFRGGSHEVRTSILRQGSSKLRRFAAVA